MSRWIRWPGLIAFVLISGGIAAGAVLYADHAVKRAIETGGTRAVGARVELGGARLIFSPLGVALHDLQVTDPDAPLRNAVQIEHIAFALDGGALLRRKVIIEEMRIDGVRLNTPRATSGAVAQRPAAEPAQPFGFTLPDLDLPDIGAILGQEELAGQRLAEEVRAGYAGARDAWRARIAQLPDAERFKGYGEQLRALEPRRTGDMLADLQALADALKEARRVRDAARADIDALDGARRDLTGELKALADRAAAIPEASRADLARLKAKYTLSPEGLANASAALFGEQAAAWTRLALDWYQRLLPLLEARRAAAQTARPARGRGIDVSFPERHPQPGFLIRSARVSLELPAARISGTLSDLASDQSITRRPATFELRATETRRVRAIRIDGRLDHTDPAAPRDTAAAALDGYRIEGVALARRRPFPLTLREAAADFAIDVELRAEQLRADVDARFSGVMLEAGLDDKASRLARAMAGALSEVKAFDARMELRGTLREHHLRLRSSLDEVLRRALGEQLRAMAEQFERELRAKLQARLDERLEKLGLARGEAGEIDDRLKERLRAGRERLAQIEDDLKRLAAQEKERGAAAVQDKTDALEKKAEEQADKLKRRLRERLR